MLPPKGAKGALVAASSQKQGKTGWLFGLCVIMAFLVLIAGCEEKAPEEAEHSTNARTQATGARKSRREVAHRRGYPPEEDSPVRHARFPSASS